MSGDAKADAALASALGPGARIISKAMKTHDTVAQALHATGSWLRCDLCHRKGYPSASQMATYLRSGWPQCCGETMTLTSKPGHLQVKAT